MCYLLIRPCRKQIGWRANALKVIVFVSDEDSDKAWYPANRVDPGQTSGPVTVAPGVLSTAWQQEIYDTANEFQQESAQLHQLVNPGFQLTTL